MAPQVLAHLPLRGQVVTGDALYCQRTLCRQIRQQGGHYLFTVKENQPRLYADLALLFEWPAPGETFAEAEQPDRHGDRHEVRHLWVSTALDGSLDWPGVRQVCKIERTVRPRGQVSREIRYGITSLGPQVGPAWLLRLWRGH